ncbi:MAG: MBL fold metallo-hydrolase [Gammaproteobacteria bacterium]|nr:MBL fold metallo-hydrolase [Gammaproteobacteria bacterium]MCI0591056.1 MBL fold metallo-hydrolase [Gammaproteobacteria bacterium]
MDNAYIRFWGVRGSYTAPFASHMKVGGNTSCVEIRVGDDILVCDAGTGIIPFGNEIAAQESSPNLMLVLTHYHWDHICGLPFFVPAFMPNWNIKIFGPGQSTKDIEERLAAQMRTPYFPVETEHWMANIKYVEPGDGSFKHGPISIAYHNVHHPGVTYGYRIRVCDKTVVYISDNECLSMEKSINQRYQEFNEEERRLLDKMKDEERDIERRLISNADILIHDAQYTPVDYEKKRGWGHSCYIDTINFAIDANVQHLYLYHHDPNYSDEDIEKIHKHCLEIVRERNSSINCNVAREGVTIKLA